MKLPRTSRTSAFMRTTTMLLTAMFASACFNPTEEQIVGTVDGGSDAGTTDAGAQVRMDAGPDGDATCDQSACLPTTVTLARAGVAQLLLEGNELFALSPTYGSGLARIELSTGASSLLSFRQSDPLDASGPLRLKDGYLYLLSSWAGEIFGIPARVRLSDGNLEGRIDSTGGSRNVERAFDVDATELVFATSANLQRIALANFAEGTTQQNLFALPSNERVTELRLTATHVWWVSNTGLHRVARDGTAHELLHAGDYEHLRIDGNVLWFCGTVGGLVRFENGVGTKQLNDNVQDFALARGTVFALRRAGTTVQVVDVGTGAVAFVEELGTTNAVQLRLEVTATRLVLATPSRLVMVSSTPGTSACGCDAPAVVLPAAAATCERALCGGPLQRNEGFTAGDFSGADFLGVFRNNAAGTQQLKKVNDLATLAFDVVNPYGEVAADGTAVFLYALGAIYAVDSSTGTSRLVLDGVNPFGAGAAAGAPMLQLDATHVYAVDQGKVLRVSRSGGQREDLGIVSSYVQGLRLDATHVYAMRNGTLLRVAKTGGTVEVLATGATGEAGFDLSGDHVYFGTARGLERVRKSGGFKSLVLSHAQLGNTGFTRLAIQGREAAMLIHPATGGDRIVRVDLQTLARQDVLTLPTNTPPQAVVISPHGYALSTYDETKLQLRDCCP